MEESTKTGVDAGGVFEEYDLIHVYSRAEAIEDGMLLDVKTVAREMGFRYPTAITHAAWHDCVAWNDADSERKGVMYDENQRLRHVLARLLIAIRTSGFKDGGMRMRGIVAIAPDLIVGTIASCRRSYRTALAPGAISALPCARAASISASVISCCFTRAISSAPPNR